MEDHDFWRGIILYGINAATYKIALGKSLLTLATRGEATVHWEDLSREFLQQYLDRLAQGNRPQQGNPAHKTTMERIVARYAGGKGSLSLDSAIQEVAREGFVDVIPRFQTIGTDKEIVAGRFYEFDFGKKLTLKDATFALAQDKSGELQEELEARWSLLEGAFIINQGQFQLANDVRETYLLQGYARTNLTKNIPFLQAYQGNVCFYCCEPMPQSDVHVDHVLPRQVVFHDEIWNLVLCHSTCNLLKSDKLVPEHYVTKLVARNENIMGSNHPWKHKISRQLGERPQERSATLGAHYAKIGTALGPYYWGGVQGYVPANDPFYRRLITQLNNRG